MRRVHHWREAVADGVRFDLRPDQLGPDAIEPGIWPVVQAFNRLGWAWTRYSCEGHLEERADRALLPYVQLAVPAVQRHVVLDAVEAELGSWAVGPGELRLWFYGLSAGWRGASLVTVARKDEDCEAVVRAARLRLGRVVERLAEVG